PPASEASPPASALPPQAVRAIPAAKPSAASETSRFLRTFTASPFVGVRPEAVHRGGVTAGTLRTADDGPPAHARTADELRVGSSRLAGQGNGTNRSQWARGVSVTTPDGHALPAAWSAEVRAMPFQ